MHHLQILGILDNVERCNVCPKGYFSEAKSKECKPCPMNSVSAKSASATCAVCTGATFAYPGEAACRPAKPCKESDRAVKYSSCNGGKRTRTYQWTQPKICSGGIELNAPAQIDCAPCPPGTYRNDAACKYCPAGTFNANKTFEGSAVCKQCPAGTIAKKVSHSPFHSRAFRGCACPPDNLLGALTPNACLERSLRTPAWKQCTDSLPLPTSRI